jgi:hypothetical protein
LFESKACDDIGLLQVGKNVFTMDFKAPFSALSAFATCLTAFEFKLAFE